MSKKKILAVVLVVVLLLTAIGGTLAYLTDTEEAVNTFTVGNVDIELLESQYYTNVDKASDADIRASAENYQTYLANAGKNVVPGREFMKAIYIDNVGNTAAYVRIRMVVTRDQFNTFYFYENTDALQKGIMTKGIIAHYPGGGQQDYSSAYDAETAKTDFTAIKADPYWTELEYVYTYVKPLAADDLTDDSPVWKFMMKDGLDNEDLEGLKANTNILVYADAIQEEGFDTAEEAFAAFADQKNLTGGNVDTWDGTVADDFGPEEDGTYVIDSAEELAAFAAAVNDGDTFAGKTVKLNTNVILADHDWTAIKSFAGTFDGQGYYIFGLTNASLFGTVTGTVQNLNLDGVNRAFAAYTNQGTSAFIGTVASGAVVDNCTVSDVALTWADTVTDCGDGISGVIGNVSADATVKNCELNNITITAYGKLKRTGGVFSAISGTVSNCTANGINIITTGKGYTQQAGGFVGTVGNGANISDCNIDNVTVTTEYAALKTGGFAGLTYGGTITNCDMDNVTMSVGKTYSEFAGFIGQHDSRSNDARVAVIGCDITGLDMTVKGYYQNWSCGSAGFISGVSGGADITNCSVAGTINAAEATVAVGGFVGSGGSSTGSIANITNCVANVDITVGDNVGGAFIGRAGRCMGANDDNIYFNFVNCEANGTVTASGTGTAGAFYGEIFGTQNTFTGCKVDGVAFIG